MHASRLVGLVLVSGLVACSGAPQPKVFGTSPNLTPTVEVLGRDRVPMHLRIQLPQSAQVAAFFVVPGQGTQMLWPSDSTGSKPLPPGIQEVATWFATRTTVDDSSRLLRRPGRPPQNPDLPQGAPVGGQRQGGQFVESSYVLVYAAQDSLSYKTLNDRVIGVSLPGYTDEAFNTVTKLVRSATTGNGAWTAVAVPFRP